ncbi:late competence development ComFB family protein [Sporosarcina gallistercoris]|uniref:Late competence development ComFB family protein n=1 Tax=Sporosarcina gallistercoris TaxID=2762245 RepID=A0ABR8PLD9_9BACL|nr:late competence development ComFB family protein [Sporosarcina gallistercoris]MBD7908982.1 late competence development ComFB family protein [Sporosarcina gallistercoris]
MEENAVGVHNVMEDVVRDTLLSYKNNMNLACDCEQCLSDISALALNELPPRYIANSKYSPYVRASHEADHQGITTIIAVIAKSAALVSESPRCETFVNK